MAAMSTFITTLGIMPSGIWAMCREIPQTDSILSTIGRKVILALVATSTMTMLSSGVFLMGAVGATTLSLIGSCSGSFSVLQRSPMELLNVLFISCTVTLTNGLIRMVTMSTYGVITLTFLNW